MNRVRFLSECIYVCLCLVQCAMPCVAFFLHKTWQELYHRIKMSQKAATVARDVEETERKEANVPPFFK